MERKAPKLKLIVNTKPVPPPPDVLPPLEDEEPATKKRQKQTGFEWVNLTDAQRAHLEAVIADPAGAPIGTKAFNWWDLTDAQKSYYKPTREQIRNWNPWKHFFVGGGVLPTFGFVRAVERTPPRRASREMRPRS